jgi:hypothetical protein
MNLDNSNPRLDVVSNAVDQPLSGAASVNLDFGSSGAPFFMGMNDKWWMKEFELLYPSVPNMVGQLGELQPISGNTKSWKWVIEQLKGYPRAFAQHSETTFIHRDLIPDPVTQAIRTAFGVSAIYVCMNESNQSMLFRTIDSEVSELLKPATGSTLLEDLSKMQALVLYQIIRMFHDDLKQRTLAEQQQSLLGTRALQLLRRGDVELRDIQPTWETWLLTETIRRTVIVTFMVHAVYSIFKMGICPELPTLSVLPVSTRQDFWSSRAAYREHSAEDETMKYTEFTAFWLASPSRKLDAFEKMILVACKGIEPVEALSCPKNVGSISLEARLAH